MCGGVATASRSLLGYSRTPPMEAGAQQRVCLILLLHPGCSQRATSPLVSCRYLADFPCLCCLHEGSRHPDAGRHARAGLTVSPCPHWPPAGGKHSAGGMVELYLPSSTTKILSLRFMYPQALACGGRSL